MSGLLAAPGACPAQAQSAPARAVVTSSAATVKPRFMSRLLICCGGCTRPRRQGRRRQWFAESEMHGGDLLLLGHDYFLRHAPQRFVVPVTQLGLGHFDR